MNILSQLGFCRSFTVGLTQSVFVFVVSGNVISVLVDIWRVISMSGFLFVRARFLTRCANSSGLTEKVGGKF